MKKSLVLAVALALPAAVFAQRSAAPAPQPTAAPKSDAAKPADSPMAPAPKSTTTTEKSHQKHHHKATTAPEAQVTSKA